jgi:polyribonucleotide nucleotidyltransferase
MTGQDENIHGTDAVIDNGSFGSRTIRFETGRLARQAAGSCTATLDDETFLLSATTAGKKPKDNLDFFPLTVDVEERMYSLGRIPGSFFRREGRPSEDAILTCRLIDRPLRPSFAKGLRNEIQVVVTVMGLHPTTCTTCWRSTPRRCRPSSRACRSAARSAPPGRLIGEQWCVPDPHPSSRTPSSTWSSPAASSVTTSRS